MTRMIDVEIDETGKIHPVDPNLKLPQGYAVLVWSEGGDHRADLLSETDLADWLRPEEEEAWAYLQPPSLRQ
jgi:hypothetical protein